MTFMSRRIRLKFRWYVFATILGLLAAAATYAWLDGPRWRDASAGPGADPHFSQDGKTLTTFHGLKSKLGEPFAPSIVKWDTASGRKLSETPLEWKGPEPNPADRLHVTSPSGGDKILAGTYFPGGGPGMYYDVHDVVTGKKIAGAIHTVREVKECSSHGRWFVTNQTHSFAITILQVENGDPVLTLGFRVAKSPTSSAFSPDGNRVAVHWKPKDNGPGDCIVIYELPSGRELEQIDLPNRSWAQIMKWDADNRLYAEVHEPDPTGNTDIAGNRYYFRRSYSLGIAENGANSERPEPLRSGHSAGPWGRQSYWESGNGWVAQLTTLQLSDRPPYHLVLQWLDKTLGTRWTPPWESNVRIRMLEATTGEVRCEVPQARMGCTFSRDGRWIASAGDAVEVWSVPPPRATLWSTIAGFAVGLVVIGLGAASLQRKLGEDSDNSFPSLR